MELPNTPDPGLRRRIIYFVTGSLLALLGLAFVVYFVDAPLGDHSDLLPEPSEEPDGNAAYTAWLGAARVANTDFPELGDLLEAKQPWDTGAGSRLLAANEKAIAAAVLANGLGPVVLPRQKRPNEKTAYLDAFHDLVNVLNMVATHHAETGHFVATRDTAGLLLRFASRVTEGGGPLFALVMGIGFHANGRFVIEHIADKGAPVEILAGLEEALAVETDFTAALRRTARHDFSVMGAGVDFFLSNPDALEGYFDDAPPRLLFNRNRTINHAAAVFRDAMADASRPPGKRFGPPDDSAPEGWSRFRVNAFGRNLIDSELGTYWLLLGQADQTLASQRLLRVKLVLLRHERAEGRLPATLAGLVPGYLDAIPLDPFDGLPIRYDAARGAVWVIGKDLTDNGGAADHKAARRKAPDPTLFLHPSTPTMP